MTQNTQNIELGSTVKEVEEFLHEMNLPPLTKEVKQNFLNTINHELVQSFDINLNGWHFLIIGEA